MKHAVIFLNTHAATVIALPDGYFPKAGDVLALEKCLLEGRETFHTLHLPEGPVDGIVLTMSEMDILAKASEDFTPNTDVKFGSYMGVATLSSWLGEQIFISSKVAQFKLHVFFIQWAFTPLPEGFIASPSRDLEQPTDLSQ